MYEWRGPLVEPMPAYQNQEDPPNNQGTNFGAGGDAGIGQGSGQRNEGGDDQDNQSQEVEEEDNDGGDGGSDHGDSECTPSN